MLDWHLKTRTRACKPILNRWPLPSCQVKECTRSICRNLAGLLSWVLLRRLLSWVLVRHLTPWVQVRRLTLWVQARDRTEVASLSSWVKVWSLLRTSRPILEMLRSQAKKQFDCTAHDCQSTVLPPCVTARFQTKHEKRSIRHKSLYF